MSISEHEIIRNSLCLSTAVDIYEPGAFLKQRNIKTKCWGLSTVFCSRQILFQVSTSTSLPFWLVECGDSGDRWDGSPVCWYRCHQSCKFRTTAMHPCLPFGPKCLIPCQRIHNSCETSENLIPNFPNLNPNWKTKVAASHSFFCVLKHLTLVCTQLSQFERSLIIWISFKSNYSKNISQTCRSFPGRCACISNAPYNTWSLQRFACAVNAKLAASGTCTNPRWPEHSRNRKCPRLVHSWWTNPAPVDKHMKHDLYQYYIPIVAMSAW